MRDEPTGQNVWQRLEKLNTQVVYITGWDFLLVALFLKKFSLLQNILYKYGIILHLFK